MANTSISNLAAGAAVTATDVLPNVQAAGAGPVKTTAAELKTFMSASPTLVTPNIGVAAGTSLAATSTVTATTAIGVNLTSPAYSVDIKASSGNSAIHLGPSTGTDTGAYLNAPGSAEVGFAGGANYSTYSGDYTYLAKITTASGILCANGAMILWGNTSLTAGNTFTITRRLVVSSTGTVTALGIYGTTVGGTNRSAYVDSTGLLGGLTSIRASKIDISPMPSQDWVYDLAPVTFKYRAKDEEGNYTNTPDGGVQYGLIAEDVEQVNPHFCYYDRDGKLEGVAYEKLVTPLLKVIQDLKAEVEALKARI